MPSLAIPEDPLITTLYVSGLCDDPSKPGGEAVTETDLKNHFYQVTVLVKLKLKYPANKSGIYYGMAKHGTEVTGLGLVK
jgi:hypothetical protein